MCVCARAHLPVLFYDDQLFKQFVSLAMFLESYFISRIIESRIIQGRGLYLLNNILNELHLKSYWSFNAIFHLLVVDSVLWRRSSECTCLIIPAEHVWCTVNTQYKIIIIIDAIFVL